MVVTCILFLKLAKRKLKTCHNCNCPATNNLFHTHFRFLSLPAGVYAIYSPITRESLKLSRLWRIQDVQK
ncbi:unnamed protein product [Citrullus colocynthis]|uniref:Secreted protein n=1 Tax=Citrullus colocynthis TaxID=252529 RepID=A0ABP0Z1T4_9ROSI